MTFGPHPALGLGISRMALAILNEPAKSLEIQKKHESDVRCISIWPQGALSLCLLIVVVVTLDTVAVTLDTAAAVAPVLLL